MKKIDFVNQQSNLRGVCRNNKQINVYFSPIDHYVVINLHQDGKMIDTKETKVASGPNPIWNAPFLFDLPPGDITQLPLALEFIVMQVWVLEKCSGCSKSTKNYELLGSVYESGFFKKILQGRLYTKNSVLGRVLIGSDASDAGQEHWREICSPGQKETTRWHTIHSDAV